jgi:hypothetical protein
MNQLHGEISYDLVMDDNMLFVEGCYRIPGGEWQVIIISRRPVSLPEIKPQKWESGVTGIFVAFPKTIPLNKAVVERLLTEHLGMKEWIEVRGPDSIQIR